jgi:hypothetical protein
MAERANPLLTLAWRLRSLGPPSLSSLIARLEDAQEYENFIALVREFLPERQAEILRQAGPAHQIWSFADHFQDRYFPMPDFFRGEAEGYGELTARIPVMVCGVSWDDYHEMPESYQPGLLLMTYLLEEPYEDDEGIRVALAEACAQHVTAELLRRVPETGLTREEAHRLLIGTQYEAVALWGDVLALDAGSYFLDTTYEMADEWIEWSRENVDQLTRKWQRAELIQDTVASFAKWLEEDPPGRFEELLDFIERRRRANGEAKPGTQSLPVGPAGEPGGASGRAPGAA